MDSRIITHYSPYILIRRAIEFSPGCREVDCKLIPAREATVEVLEGLEYIRTIDLNGNAADEWGDDVTVKWYESVKNL